MVVRLPICLMQGNDTRLYRQTNTSSLSASPCYNQANKQLQLHLLGLSTDAQARLVHAGLPGPGKQTRPSCRQAHGAMCTARERVG